MVPKTHTQLDIPSLMRARSNENILLAELWYTTTHRTHTYVHPRECKHTKMCTQIHTQSTTTPHTHMD